MARSSNAADLQATADAEGELTCIRLSPWEIFEGMAPLKNWQEVAVQVLATMVLDSRGVHDALSQSESSCMGLKNKRSVLVALSLNRSFVDTRCGPRWTHSAAQLTDCMTVVSEEAQKGVRVVETTELATGL